MKWDPLAQKKIFFVVFYVDSPVRCVAVHWKFSANVSAANIEGGWVLHFLSKMESFVYEVQLHLSFCAVVAAVEIVEKVDFVPRQKIQINLLRCL